MDESFSSLLNDHKSVIIHIDINCFYAQVEMIRNPSLRDKPVGIKQKNFMVTCNYIARSMGLMKCMGIKDALETLPSLILIDGSDLSPYRECSAKIFCVLQSLTKSIERLGLDEYFIDVTDMVEVFSEGLSISGHIYQVDKAGNEEVKESCECGCFGRLVAASHIAQKLRNKIFEATGITTCAGIGINKLVAKLISGHWKPNDQTVIFPSQIDTLMNSLENVNGIPGIGCVTSKTLESLGISSVSSLQTCPINVLKQKFNIDFALNLKRLAQGIDNSVVRPSGQPQTLGIEDAFRKVSSLAEVKSKMELLIDRLLKLLLNDGRFPTCIRVSIRRCKSDTQLCSRETKHTKLPQSLFGTDDRVHVSGDTKSSLVDIVLNLFTKVVDVSKPFHLTLIGLCFVRFYDRASSSQNISSFFEKIIKKPTCELAKKPKLNNLESSQSYNKNDVLSDLSPNEEFGNEQVSSNSSETMSIQKENCLNLFHKPTTVLESKIPQLKKLEIPLGYDSEVWNSLPEDVKREASACSQSWMDSNKETLALKLSKRKSLTRLTSTKHKIKCLPTNQKRIDSFFQCSSTKQTLFSNTSEDACKVIQTNLEKYEPSTIFGDISDSNSEEAETKGSASSSTFFEKTPVKDNVTHKLLCKGMSPEVFKELPGNIKEEILSNL